MILKAAGVAATLIGVITGLGTIIGWIASTESLGTVLATGVFWAGVVFTGSMALACFAFAVMPSHWMAKVPGEQALTWNDRAKYLLGGATLTAFLIVDQNDWPLPLWLLDKEESLRAIGYAVGLLALVLIGLWGRSAVQRVRESHRVCPDCKETIKADSNVCRYCGFRFGPRPDWPPE